MKHYNKSEVLKRAWYLYKNQSVKTDSQFSDCLKDSWKYYKESINNFDAIYKKYYKEVLNYITFKMNGNYSIAEEITNNVFIAFKNNSYKYDETKSKISTYIKFMANNAIIDFWRKENKIKSETINVSDFINENGTELIQIESDDNINTIENNELSLQIKLAFNTLKPKYKKVATLAFLEEKNYNEIASICDIPIGTVKGMLNRARLMLQNELKTIKANY